jgi:hypothetical protein
MEARRAGGFVFKRVKIPEDDYEWFQETYPMYGAWTWFIQTSLAKFRESHAASPDELVELGLRALREETPREEEETE